MELIEMSKRHVEFLGAMHASGISLKRPSASSFRRYELWLTLVARVPHDKALVPPSDVAWLWHCHRLAPYRAVQLYKSAKFSADRRHGITIHALYTMSEGGAC